MHQKKFKIAVLPGDGIGPEVIGEAVKVLTAVSEASDAVDLHFEHYPGGAGHYRETGVVLDDAVYEACQASDAILFGAAGYYDVRMPDGTEVEGALVFRLRFGLNLYAGVRPIKYYEGVKTPLVKELVEGVDYVLIRESTEGLYASWGGGAKVRDELVSDTSVITRAGTERVTDFAYQLARQRRGRPLDGKRMVSCVDKSNVLASYAFFRKIFDEVGERYPEISKHHLYVDAAALELIRHPRMFDVIVTENMFGDILSDLMAATIGGMGLAPSGDIGDKHGLFQPAHGTAPDIAGKNVANPIATILSAKLMLEWLAGKENEVSAKGALEGGAKAIDAAVKGLLKDSDTITPDLGGKASTTDMGSAVAAYLRDALRGAATP
jgi:3-isopropylmalate dehydrogenase